MLLESSGREGNERRLRFAGAASRLRHLPVIVVVPCGVVMIVVAWRAVVRCFSPMAAT